MSEEIEKSNLIAGGFGTVKIASTGNVAPINSVRKNNDGSVTITLGGSNQLPKSNSTEDIECEIIEPKQIENKSFDENVKDFMNVGDNVKEAVCHAHDIEIHNLLKDIVDPKLLTDKP